MALARFDKCFSGRSLRIVHLIDNLEPGGIEKLVLMLANEYQRRGHTTEVWAFLGGGRWLSRAAESRIPVVQCTTSTKYGRLKYFISALRRFRPDVIHTHNVGGHPYVAVLATILLTKTRIVNTRHGQASAPRGGLPWLLYELTTPFTHHVIYLHEYDRRSLIHPLIRSNCILPNGVPVPRRPSLKRQTYSRLRWVTLCRLDPIKHVELMIDAFCLFFEEHKDSELHIGGQGLEYNRLLRRAEGLSCGENIYFHGHVEDATRFLRQFDGFLITSRSEGMPMAVLEAMAVGLPLVSMPLPGVQAMAPEGVAGWYAREANVVGFCAAMLEAYESGELRLRGQRAYALAAKNHSIEMIAEEHLKLYMELSVS